VELPPITGYMEQTIVCGQDAQPIQEMKDTHILLTQIPLVIVELEIKMNKERLIEIYLASLEIERIIGVPAIFSTAQAILESTWDLKAIKDSNNIYGIKWHNYYKDKNPNDWVLATTQEWDENKYITIPARFQKYESLKDCIRDHSQLLLNPRLGYLQPLLDYRKDKDLVKYVQRVARIYATDPNYANKILSLMKDVKRAIEEFKSWEVEKEEAKTWSVANGIVHPDDDEKYWTRLLSRIEFLVMLKRALGGA